jgi:hypothetical protein
LIVAFPSIFTDNLYNSSFSGLLCIASSHEIGSERISLFVFHMFSNHAVQVLENSQPTKTRAIGTCLIHNVGNTARALFDQLVNLEMKLPFDVCDEAANPKDRQLRY